MNRWEERSGGKVDGARMQCQPDSGADEFSVPLAVDASFDPAKSLTGLNLNNIVAEPNTLLEFPAPVTTRDSHSPVFANQTWNDVSPLHCFWR